MVNNYSSAKRILEKRAIQTSQLLIPEFRVNLLFFGIHFSSLIVIQVNVGGLVHIYVHIRAAGTYFNMVRTVVLWWA